MLFVKALIGQKDTKRYENNRKHIEYQQQYTPRKALDSARYSQRNNSNSKSRSPFSPARHGSNSVSIISSGNNFFEKISELRLALDSKNKEIIDLKSQNKLLFDEMNGINSKINETKLFIKNQSPEIMVNNLQKLPEQYHNLFLTYKDLVKTNIQIEESLRNETLQNEEQRVIIECLKQHIENVMDVKQILPYFKMSSNTNRANLAINKLGGHGQSQRYGNGYRDATDSHRVNEISKSAVDNYLDFLSMRDHIDNFKSTENELKEEIIALRRELDRARKEDEENEKSDENSGLNDKSKENVKKLVGSITLLQSENVKLNQEKDNLLDFIEKRLAGSENAMKRVGELAKEKDNIIQMLQERDVEINDKISENLEFVKKLDVLQAELDISRENFAAISMTLNETQADFEKLNEKYLELKSEKNDFNIKFDALEFENHTRTLNNEKSKQQNIEKDGKINELTDKMVFYETKIDEKQKLINDLTNKNSTLELDLSYVKASLHQIRNDINKQSGELSELKLDYTTLRAINERLKIDNDNLNSDIELKRKNMESITVELSDIARKLVDKEKIIAIYESDFRPKSPKKVHILEENYEIARNLQNNLLSLKEDNNKFQEKLIFLNKKIIEMTENENDLITQNTELKHNCSDFREYLNILKRELKKIFGLFFHNYPNNSNKFYEKYDNVAALPVKIDDIEQIYKEIIKNLEANRNEIEKYNKMISDFKSESNKQISSQNESLKKDKITLEKDKENLNESLISLENENKIISNELINMKLAHYNVIYSLKSFNFPL